MTTLQQRHAVFLGWFARILGMVVSLLMIRIVLRLLGDGQFAVFQLLTATFAWLSLSSLGLGPALKNLVSECRARGESGDYYREASGAVLLALFVVGSVLLVIAAPTVTHVLLRKLSHDEVWSHRAFLAGGLLSLLAALAQVSLELLYAEFRANWVYFLSILSSALTLLLLVWLNRITTTPPQMLLWVVCAALGPPAVSGILALRMTGLLRFRFGTPNRLALSRLVKLAVRFWFFAILSSLILMVDYLVISQILRASDIVLYAVMMKITMLGIVLFTTVIAVVWPEWTHNWELREWATLRKRVLSLAVIGAAVCVPGALIAVFVLPVAIRIWLHDASIIPSTLLIFEFIGYLAVRFWTDVHSAALMSGNQVLPATIFAVIQACITAPLEFAFGRVWGPEGVILGLLIGFLATAAWMFPCRFYRELKARSLQDAAISC